MSEYERLIDEYSREEYSPHFSTVSESQWGDKDAANAYCNKYWLSEHEYDGKWRAIMNRVFVNQNAGLPRLGFAPGFELLVTRGGCLFVQEEFIRLQRCMVATADQELVIVENTFGGRLTEPMFRMKYPSNVSWEELTSGSFVSAILIEMSRKEYFVFGESGVWGKYAATDYEFPLDVFGFQEECAAVFRGQFEVLEAERRELARLVPPAFRVWHPEV